MKQSTRKILYASGCAMALGLILSAAAYFGGAKISGVTFGPDGAHIANDTPQTLSREFPEGFRSLELSVEDGNVEFVPSDRFGAEISSYDGDKFSCSVSDGTLTISDASLPRRSVWMNFDFGPQKQNTVRILIPQNASLKDLKLRMGNGGADLSAFSAESTDIQDRYGNLRISDASCGAVSIKLGNGSGTLENLSMKTLTYHNDYGNSSFEDVSVSDPQAAVISAESGGISAGGFTAGSLSLTSTYGSIKLNRMKISRLVCTAKNGEMSLADSTVETADLVNSYGGIETSGLDSNGLTVNGKNGSIRLAGTMKGKNDVHSDYGNIDVKTSLPQDQYTLGLSTEYGSVKVNGNKLNGSLVQPGSGKNGLTVSGKNGSVSVDFGK